MSLDKQTSDNTILDNQPIFFTGICEARNDPQKLGRVKVRIFGIHSDKFETLNPDDLPWAFILIPTTESGSSGIGVSKGGIIPGTWVFGLFLDGEAKQQPLILGSIQGRPSQPERSQDAFPKNIDKFQETIELGVDLSKGFFDQHEEFLSGYPKPSYSSKNEQDHNRLSRGESLDKTIDESKKLDRAFNIKRASDTSFENTKKWEEYLSERKSIYPYNTVHETESGIITEKDDSPYFERTHQYFAPGHSYIECGLQGVGYEYKKTWGSVVNIKYSPEELLYTRGPKTESIDGEVFENNAQSKTTETYDTETKIIYDSYKIRTFGQINTLAGGDYVLMVNNNIRITANNQMDLDVGSKFRQSFHETHHSVYWMRQYTWNEGQIHNTRKRNYFEKNNENYHSIVIEGRRDLVAKGNKDYTISKDYKLYIGAGKSKGDYHLKIDKDQLQQTAENKDSTIGKNYTKVVKEKEEKKIGSDNRILVGKNRDIVVVENQQLEIGKTHKRSMGENDEERVQKNKVLKVEESFFNKIKNYVHKVETWFRDIQELKILCQLEEAFIKRQDHLYESIATHVLEKLSLKVMDKCTFTCDDTVGIHIKGKLLIQAEQGIILSSKNGEFTFGCKNEFIMGSSTGMKVSAPNLIVTKDDIVIPASKTAYTPPEINVSTIDLSHLKKMECPEIPEIKLNINKELDNKKPENPELPEKAKIGEFVNTRIDWEKDNKLSRSNDSSSLA